MAYELILLIMKVVLLLVLLLAATIYRAPTRGCFTYIITIGSHYFLSSFLRRRRRYGGTEWLSDLRLHSV